LFLIVILKILTFHKVV